MIRIIIATALLFGCGNSIDVRFSNPEPKRFEVGESAFFVLDPGASSNLLKSGTLDMTIVSIDTVETSIKGTAKLQTIIGGKDFEVTQSLENELLNLDFLESLRSKKTHQAKNGLLTYVGLSKEGCDIIAVSNIRGSDGLTVTPVLCVSSSTIPQVTMKLDASGTVVTAVFKSAQ